MCNKECNENCILCRWYNPYDEVCLIKDLQTAISDVMAQNGLSPCSDSHKVFSPTMVNIPELSEYQKLKLTQRLMDELSGDYCIGRSCNVCPAAIKTDKGTHRCIFVHIDRIFDDIIGG